MAARERLFEPGRIFPSGLRHPLAPTTAAAHDGGGVPDDLPGTDPPGDRPGRGHGHHLDRAAGGRGQDDNGFAQPLFQAVSQRTQPVAVEPVDAGGDDLDAVDLVSLRRQTVDEGPGEPGLEPL